jgi:hypothetical protein
MLHDRVHLDAFRHTMLGDEVENLLRLLDAYHAAAPSKNLPYVQSPL